SRRAALPGLRPAGDLRDELLRRPHRGSPRRTLLVRDRRGGARRVDDVGPRAVPDRRRRARRLPRRRLPGHGARCGEPRRVPGPPAHFEGGRSAWLIWPTGFPAADDPRTLSHAQYLQEAFIDPILARTARGGAYNAESLLARAHLARTLGDAAALGAVQDAVRFFVRELPTFDTHHLGEFYARVDADLNGDGIAPDYV